MHRKSRGKKKEPRPSVGPIDSELLSDDPTSVYPISPDGQRLVDAIVSGLALLATGQPPGDSFEDSLDFPDAQVEATDAEEDDDGIDEEIALTITTRVLTRALLAQTLGREPAVLLPNVSTGDDESRQEDALRGVTESLMEGLLPPNAPSVRELPRSARDYLADDLTDLVNEIGLEEFESDCELILHRDGTSELLAMPVSPDAALVFVAPYLFQRLETSLLVDDALPAMERDASSWEFARWYVSPPARDVPDDIASTMRTVREQEYSLVERRMVSFGMTAVESLIGDGTAAAMFPRQSRLAEAYAASIAGIYECIAADGELTTVRSVTDDTVLTIREHIMPREYDVGDLLLGRLLPFPDEGWHLRSPGLDFVRPRSPDLARAAADAFRQYSETLPRALAVEAVISSVVYGISVPRAAKPKTSRAHARETIELIRELSEETEWESAVARAFGGPPPASPDFVTTPRYYTPSAPSVELDATLDAFFAALMEQASAGKAGDDRKRAAKSKQSRRRR